MYENMLRNLPMLDEVKEWFTSMEWEVHQDFDFQWKAYYSVMTVEIKSDCTLLIHDDNKAMVFKLAWL